MTVVQSRAFVRATESHRVVVKDVRVLQVTVDYNMHQGQDHQTDSAEASDYVRQGRVRSHRSRGHSQKSSLVLSRNVVKDVSEVYTL